MQKPFQYRASGQIPSSRHEQVASKCSGTKGRENITSLMKNTCVAKHQWSCSPGYRLQVKDTVSMETVKKTLKTLNLQNLQYTQHNKIE